MLHLFSSTIVLLAQKLLPETMGGGVAFFDYNNDDAVDLLLVNSCYWPDDAKGEDPPPKMCLYRNDGKGSFTDVTADAGLDITLYGMGVAIGDYDNDLDLDFYFTIQDGH